MKEMLIEGKYAVAKVFTVDNEEHAIDPHAAAQIKMICDNEISKDAVIRVMPDVHAGKVGPIGLTMKLAHRRVIPNLLGNDIGCGLSIFRLYTKNKKLTASDFAKLDKVIRERAPAFSNDKIIHDDATNIIDSLAFSIPIDVDKAAATFGTLGGGNHFIEIDKDEEGNYYLSIHSGSRAIGPMINDHYNRTGQKILKDNGIEVPYEMTYIEGDLYDDYVSNCVRTMYFASLSRRRMADEICKGMKWKINQTTWNMYHNSITYNHVLRKGSAFIGTNNYDPDNHADYYNDPVVYIPINMKDGILYGKVKPNPDWNFSVPHGSGRLIKRSDVKNTVSLSMFKKEMEGIYSTSVDRDTLDEAPFAYRRIDELRSAISGVVDVLGVLKPVYSFKAGRR